MEKTKKLVRSDTKGVVGWNPGASESHFAYKENVSKVEIHNNIESSILYSLLLIDTNSYS